ncbi:DUF2285 domain-containing protein [Xanthobacter versatilis]|uniref:DUF2285 domain-containing protein n=1 Tax=Xanthobacter autotrophicus (strain ATCC BAA-1158 / Py2) TaxID=78245 RepID=UPI00372BF1D1
MQHESGACDFPVDPACRAADATIFWLPEEDTSSVILTVAPPAFRSSSDVLSLLKGSDLVRAEDGLHHLRDLPDGQRLHLVFPPEAAPDRPLAAVVPLSLDGFDRLEAVARLLAALHGREVTGDTRLTPQQQARARRMLQAADGRQDGASQKEIAEVVLHTGRLTRDEWQASSARHAVMGLLRGARDMIAGGYRKLLRHRRRS